MLSFDYNIEYLKGPRSIIRQRGNYGDLCSMIQLDLITVSDITYLDVMCNISSTTGIQTVRIVFLSGSPFLAVYVKSVVAKRGISIYHQFEIFAIEAAKISRK